MRVRVMITVFTALLGLQIASADVFSIDKDNSAGALCSLASPCGTVTVTGASTLHVVISMNSPFGVFGNKETFGFNVVGSTAGLAMSGFSNANFNGGGGPGNEDGWGNFDFRVDGPGGSGAISSLSFDVTRTGGFTGPGDIEAGATDGGNGPTIFGLHVRNNTTGLTVFAGVDPVAGTVPEPGSIVLLGSVMLAVGYSTRKRNKGRAAASSR